MGRIYGSGPAAVEALKDVDLEIWPGEFVVLLGPSGSGKTTLRNLVGGIEEPTGGRIEVAGKDIASPQGKERTLTDGIGSGSCSSSSTWCPP